MSILSTGETRQETCRRLAGEIEANLQTHILGQWFPRVVDTQRGGFHQNYAEDWTRLPRGDRSVVYQSRLTWLAARTAHRYPDLAAPYLEYARHGLQFLSEHLWDSEHGGFFWSLNEEGVPERGGEKSVYGVSFAIYAAAAVVRVTSDESVLALARRAYSWLQEFAHDPVHGGWIEAFTRRNQPLLTPTPNASRDFVGSRYGGRTMNTHIHLLESLTALCEVWPDADLRADLVEAFEIVRDKIAVESVGCLNLFFTPDWRALPDHDSFGHDIETAFLLVEAAAALGMPDDARTWALARRIGDHALDFGWDETHGGFYDGGGVYGGGLRTHKVWWVQAEGLNTLLLLHKRFGGETDRYWTAFTAQWEFIQSHQIDTQHGGWYEVVSREGVAVPGRRKSDRWTECYHQGRALLTVAAGLRALAG